MAHRDPSLSCGFSLPSCKPIDQQGKEKWGAEVDFKKSNRKSAVQAAPSCEKLIGPTKLRLLEGHFVHEGQPLPQIDFNKIKAGCTGVAFCRTEDALPYLSSGKTISVDPLLLLTVGQLPELSDHLRCRHQEVPAITWAQVNPFCCDALRFNLVMLMQPRKIALTCQQCSVVCRLHWFRDEATSSWQDISRRPIKALVENTPLLQLCRDDSCNKCGLFHPTVEEHGLDGVLIDMWGWKWCAKEGKKCKALDSEVFQLYVRLPESVLGDLLSLSGEQGIYWDSQA